ncbi:hypothetical protein [Mycetohabitans rhizoxinica]|uniref:hypothetical protein n=1 Tax=Mycetohabitans rhizoxinica TaxID=412963 RepID=UPI0030D2DC95
MKITQSVHTFSLTCPKRFARLMSGAALLRPRCRYLIVYCAPLPIAPIANTAVERVLLVRSAFRHACLCRARVSPLSVNAQSIPLGNLSGVLVNNAYSWLCIQRRHYSAHANTWHLRFHWQTKLVRIKNALVRSTYRFEPLSHIAKTRGETLVVGSPTDVPL